MKVLGFRQLKSLGLLEIKKAFMKLDVNSMRQNAEKSNLEERKFITSTPSDVGPNPNLSEIFTIEINLPIDLKYTPVMSVQYIIIYLKSVWYLMR